MFSSRNQHKLARSALLLVSWVICVCLASNMFLIQVCKVVYANNESTIPAVAQVSNADGDDAINKVTQPNDDSFNDKCELSEHLINFDHHQVNDQAIFMYFVLLTIVLWLLSTVPYFPPFTEPILHKGRRIHLKICVFRE